VTFQKNDKLNSEDKIVIRNIMYVSMPIKVAERNVGLELKHYYISVQIAIIVGYINNS